MGDLLGSIAAFLTTCSFVPQVVHTIRTKDTVSISLLMYSMFWTGILFWLIYGLVLVSWPMIIANSITLLLSGVVLIIKFKNYSSDKLINASKRDAIG